MENETASSIVSVINIYVISILAGFGSLTLFATFDWLGYTEYIVMSLGVTVAVTATVTLYVDRTHSYRFEDEEDDDSDSDSSSNPD